ncbi:unnamed protein product [Rotaria sp. Silwood1]|nr:unnamed protein product [Rotaria sp. Silwood1]CAF4873416.1 unnamed protein product [Rotaria sp. Silwood1]
MAKLILFGYILLHYSSDGQIISFDLQTIDITLYYEERILPPITNEILKSVVDVSELLTECVAQFGLLLDDISIAEQSRQANFIAAEGDARAADLIGKALGKAGDGLFYSIKKKENQINNALDDIKVSGSISSSSIAHFQLVLPHDHRFGINSILIGICCAGTGDHGFSRRRLPTGVSLINQYCIGSILLENPYYGLRKPPDQSCSSLLYVTDLYVMGKTLVLLHWCQKNEINTNYFTWFFSCWSDPLSLLFCASWSSSSTVFCDSVLSRTIPWPLLKRQFYENKAYQTFYDYLRERNRSIDSSRIVVDPIKDMMRLFMDEFTSLHNYSRPIQSILRVGIHI